MSPIAHATAPVEKKRKLKAHSKHDEQPSKKARKAAAGEPLASQPSGTSNGQHAEKKRSKAAKSAVEQVVESNGNSAPSPKLNHPNPRSKSRSASPSLTQAPLAESAKAQKQRKQKTSRADRGNGQVTQKSSGDVAIVPDKAIPTPLASSRRWHVSEPIGGQFGLLDPCYTLDEKYMFLATSGDLLVYTLSSSLLLRRISVSTSQPIVAITLSRSNSELVFVALADGTVALIDWSNNSLLKTINFGCAIVALAVAAVEDQDADTLFLIIKANDTIASQSHLATVVFVHKLDAEKQGSLEQLSATYTELEHLQILDGARVIFAASKTTVLIGWSPRRRGNAYTEKDDSLKHMFKAIDFPEGLTCFHARYFSQGEQKSDSKKRAVKGNTFSLATGSTHGAIYVYDDILSVFRAPDFTVAKPRKLHWHRNPVASLKWSADGNYLISGGEETVLVIWQLETNRRQDLPHLTAQILHITVSPSGTSYALRLADNSVIVLSTSELAPKAIISGLQVKCATSLVERVEKSAGELCTSAVENPRTRNQILLAVPASGSARSKSHQAPFLQTFDIFENRHISRQALTRNNTVNLNQAPAGHSIEEANIQKIQISTDGLWLATTEEWCPPSVDIHDMIGATEPAEVSQEVKQRRESYLKFWQWEHEKQQWTLHARIDTPHRVDWHPHLNRIISLEAIPGQPGFATVGEDAVVRIWTPKSRLKDGTIRRGVVADGQTTWICSVTIELENVTLDSDREEDQGKYQHCSRASLAFSPDGTILAVSINNRRGLVHLYDVATGALQATLVDVYDIQLTDMSFLGQYLVILSQQVRVWDIVSNQLVMSHDLWSDGSRPRFSLNLLATNEGLGHFAVAHTRFIGSVLQSRVLLFAPKESEPILSIDDSSVVTALIASNNASGFIILNAKAQLRTVQSTSSQSLLRRIDGTATQTTPIISSDADIESVNVLQVTAAGALVDEDDDNDDDMDRTFTRGNQLADLFQGVASHALPPVQDLFHTVAKLYIGKPNT